MADKQREDGCPVCLKEFGNSRIGKLPCGHIFCSICIEEWSKVFMLTYEHNKARPLCCYSFYRTFALHIFQDPLQVRILMHIARIIFVMTLESLRPYFIHTVEASDVPELLL